MIATFKTNINCGNCIRTVSPVLNALDNVESWQVDIENPDKILTVELDDQDVDTVIKSVESAGFEILLID